MTIPMNPIDSAPKDGTEIWTYDGNWWRRLCNWLVEPMWSWDRTKDPWTPGWYYLGFLPISPTHWTPPDEGNAYLMAEIRKALR
jgi:hypothetical protein